MWPISCRATVSTSNVLGAAPMFQVCSVSSKCTGLGRVLVTTEHPGGKSAWARTPPTMLWSGSLAGRQPIRTSGLAFGATSVNVKFTTLAQVAKALRTAWNSPWSGNVVGADVEGEGEVAPVPRTGRGEVDAVAHVGQAAPRGRHRLAGRRVELAGLFQAVLALIALEHGRRSCRRARPPRSRPSRRGSRTGSGTSARTPAP